MSSKTLFRLSGWALLIGFVLVLAGQLLQLALPPMSDIGKFYTNSLFLPSYFLFWSGAILQAIGLPGLYARVAKQIGILGLLGFVFTFFGLMVVEISVDLAEMAVFPPLAANAQSLPVLKMVSLPLGVFASLLLLFLGVLLFGIALLRSRAFPRGVGIGVNPYDRVMRTFDDPGMCQVLRAIAPLERESGFHGIVVFQESLSKALQFRNSLLFDQLQPGIQSLALPLSKHGSECLDQFIRVFGKSHCCPSRVGQEAMICAQNECQQSQS